jgi:DNA-directed RNA polymerase subunit RPC12/RpoP
MIDNAVQVDYVPFQQEKTMAIYKCGKCGMSIGTMTCGECGKELVHETLTLDSGAKVDIAKCPEGHGKVKSPQCCGDDMTCSI